MTTTTTTEATAATSTTIMTTSTSAQQHQQEEEVQEAVIEKKSKCQLINLLLIRHTITDLISNLYSQAQYLSYYNRQPFILSHKTTY